MELKEQRLMKFNHKLELQLNVKMYGYFWKNVVKYKDKTYNKKKAC